MRPFISLLFVLPFIAGAADTTPSLTPQQYYQRAIERSDKIAPDVHWMMLVMFADKTVPEESSRYQAMQEDVANINADLDKAAHLGFPPAIYARSNNQNGIFRGPSETEREQSCEALLGASRQGFLAAAVAYVYRCGPRIKGFNFLVSERPELIKVLKETLRQEDHYRAVYPLILPESNCFGVQRSFSLPTVDTDGVRTTLKERMSRTLTYDQFRAEALLFIANYGEDEQRASHMEQAEALGCRYRAMQKERAEMIRQISKPSSNK